MQYILSVGTNIGDRRKNILDAIGAINLIPKTSVLRQSAIYETQPVGYDEQDNFYNLVLLVDSELEPNEMLGACLGIEAGFGRIRTIKNGPRVLDIDIIFAENKRISTRNLTVPHPRYFQRRFVLEPLLELYPDGQVFGFEVKAFVDKIENQGIKKVEE